MPQHTNTVHVTFDDLLEALRETMKKEGHVGYGVSTRLAMTPADCALVVGAVDGLRAELAEVQRDRDRLKADQTDWRKAMGQVAGAAGIESLSGPAVAEQVLKLHAEFEATQEERDNLQRRIDRLGAGDDIESDRMTSTDDKLVKALVERDAAQAQAVQLQAAFNRVRGAGEPHPLVSVLRVLGKAATYLLNDHDCKSHSPEKIELCRDLALDYIVRLDDCARVFPAKTESEG